MDLQRHRRFTLTICVACYVPVSFSTCQHSPPGRRGLRGLPAQRRPSGEQTLVGLKCLWRRTARPQSHHRTKSSSIGSETGWKGAATTLRLTVNSTAQSMTYKNLENLRFYEAGKEYVHRRPLFMFASTVALPPKPAVLKSCLYRFLTDLSLTFLHKMVAPI